ncbi:MAG: VOC family protein [candidate division KSB1 bacterium]|nr:VOC family protein [candidate division KSB1 bacterium]
MQKITPFLWFDSQAEEAAKFYTSLFKSGKIGRVARYGKEGFEIHHREAGSVMTVDFELMGYQFTGLNGGPMFKFTPAISFFVVCETEAEIDALWQNLSQGGMAMMPLQKYDWSEKYGWVQDKFGLSWQVSLGRKEDVGQTISPFLMFVGKQHGRAEEALRFYTSLFKNSEVVGILRYGPGEPGPEGTVKHAQFRLHGEVFMVIDAAGEHPFTFNEALSLVVNCETQEEVDYFWEQLSVGGEKSRCGWLKDKFGVSWQVVPTILDELMRDKDAQKTGRVMHVMLQMDKLDIKTLQQAYAGR